MRVGMQAITYQSPMKRGTSTAAITGSGAGAERQALSRSAVMSTRPRACAQLAAHFIAYRAPVGGGLQRQPFTARRIPQLDRVLAAGEGVVLGRHAVLTDPQALAPRVAHRHRLIGPGLGVQQLVLIERREVPVGEGLDASLQRGGPLRAMHVKGVLGKLPVHDELVAIVARP